MTVSLLLAFREGLEAALLVGIILSYLSRIGHTEGRKQVWGAVAAAAAASLVLAVLFQVAGFHFEGQAEYVFEGIAMLVAVGVLTWMIFWMRAQSTNLKGDLEAEVSLAVRKRDRWALFSLAFLAVFREGVELALFLTAASFTADAATMLLGSFIGLALSVVAGWALYNGTLRLNLRRFFDVTSVLLLIFAAGLFAHGIHELQEAGWLPVFIEHLWNMKPVLDDGAPVGAVLRVLIGYNDNPSLLEALSYVVYWGVILVVLQRWGARQAAPRPSAAA